MIGVVGLGRMGRGVALSLRRAGYDVMVRDLSKAAAEPLIDAGAVWAESAAAVGEACEVVLTSLPGPKEVEALATAPDGLGASLARGSAWFDLSTNAPQTVRQVHDLLAKRAVGFLDAPVSGGPVAAASGSLAVWVGGDRILFDRHRAMLDAIATWPRHVGDIGAGTVVKLVHNCTGYAIQAVLAETFSLGVKAGVEPLTLWEAVRDGAVGRRRTFDGLVDQFLPGVYEPPGFTLRLAHKDVDLAMELGRHLGVPMALSDLAFAELSGAMDNGWEDRDARVAMLVQLQRAGVEVAVDPERIRQVLDR